MAGNLTAMKSYVKAVVVGVGLPTRTEDSKAPHKREREKRVWWEAMELIEAELPELAASEEE